LVPHSDGDCSGLRRTFVYCKRLYILTLGYPYGHPRTVGQWTPPPPTPQPQPFSVGVFSCQTARNAANRLGFLRATADLPSRPPTPPWGLLHSLLAVILSNPGLPSGPEVRSRENFCRSTSVGYTRTDRCGFCAALGSGGDLAAWRGAAPAAAIPSDCVLPYISELGDCGTEHAVIRFGSF